MISSGGNAPTYIFFNETIMKHSLSTLVVKAIRHSNPAASVYAKKIMAEVPMDMNDVKNQCYFWRREIIVIPGSIEVRSYIDDSLSPENWINVFRTHIAPYLGSVWYDYIQNKK